jgi:hypothetical protein
MSCFLTEEFTPVAWTIFRYKMCSESLRVACHLQAKRAANEPLANDCHFAAYSSYWTCIQGTVAEEHWLSGETFGWRGPWGTAYGSNLRTFVNALTEDQWFTVTRALRARPPMPWFNLKAMHDEDLKALYRFIRYLGPVSPPAPAYLPPDIEPDIEPKPPYALFPSPLQ